ncbi:hypothetical protein AVEN_123461-1 [Araneus ventricosus]|uniref:Uncharacterized protein n=1 Tax=Araneus ventricosus TaxID=182803 RepID=A0A4Y2MCC3_ARAVE|nr:hypothetical protein AVEN_123461-1 [Araneus ventricosus]
MIFEWRILEKIRGREAVSLAQSGAKEEEWRRMMARGDLLRHLMENSPPSDSNGRTMLGLLRIMEYLIFSSFQWSYSLLEMASAFWLFLFEKCFVWLSVPSDIFRGKAQNFLGISFYDDSKSLKDYPRQHLRAINSPFFLFFCPRFQTEG